MAAKDPTERGKLILIPRDLDAKIYLSSTGTIEVFCERKVFRSVLSLLKRKLVAWNGELWLHLDKVPITRTFSFDYLKAIFLAVYGICSINVGLLIVSILGFLPVILLKAWTAPFFIYCLGVWHHWRSVPFLPLSAKMFLALTLFCGCWSVMIVCFF